MTAVDDLLSQIPMGQLAGRLGVDPQTAEQATMSYLARRVNPSGGGALPGSGAGGGGLGDVLGGLLGGAGQTGGLGEVLGGLLGQGRR